MLAKYMARASVLVPFLIAAAGFALVQDSSHGAPTTGATLRNGARAYRQRCLDL